MTYRPLGRSGLLVSTAGLGTNNIGHRLDLETSRKIVHTALEMGITLIDTSDSYGDAEEKLGAILAGRRDEVVLATKFGDRVGGPEGADGGARAGRRYIRRAVERSLRRLRTDWIDLYQLHRPDGITPIEETLSALTELVAEGKVRYLGHSNFAAWQVAEADWTAALHGHQHFISAQNRYNLLQRHAEQELLPALRRFGLGLLPYSALANGILTGKYRRGEPVPEGSRVRQWGIESQLTEVVFDQTERLAAFAAERGLRLIDLGLAGLAGRAGVASVLAGASTPEQVRANVAATLTPMSEEDHAELERLLAEFVPGLAERPRRGPSR